MSGACEEAKGQTSGCRKRRVEMDRYPRREHFEHFLEMEDPFVEMTVSVDLTDWLPKQKASGAPFFLSFQYAVTRAANSVEAFRQRIADGGIVEYEFCNPSYTVALPDGTYRYCTVNAEQPFEAYLAEAQRRQALAMQAAHLEDEGEVESLIFISSVPWITYDALAMPRPDKTFSIPSITWGRYRTEEKLTLRDGELVSREEVTIPVTVLVNHALVDGLHIARFFKALEKELEGFYEDP